jgi:lysozyme
MALQNPFYIQRLTRKCKKIVVLLHFYQKYAIKTKSRTDGQFDALVSFTYNLGGEALQRSTLRRKINREEHAEVPEQFMRWVWAGGRKLRGLVRRRAAEAKVYLNDQ